LTVFSSLKDFLLGIYDLILPGVCVSCNGKMESLTGFICAQCSVKIKSFGGRKIIFRDSPGIGQAVYTYPYKPLNGLDMGNAVRVLKYSGYQTLAREIASIMVDVLQDYPQYFEVDGIVSMPLHPVRERHRGFNQCDLIAKEIARALGIELVTLLTKKRNTVPQVELSPEEREFNALDAYTVSGKIDPTGKSYIIFDDQITTGATIKNAAKALINSGATYILGLSVTH